MRPDVVVLVDPLCNHSLADAAPPSVLDRYSEPDSNSQKRGGYHAHIVEVQLS